MQAVILLPERVGWKHLSDGGDGSGVDKKDVEAANGIFKTPTTGIKLLLAAIYLQQLFNVRTPAQNPGGSPGCEL